MSGFPIMCCFLSPFHFFCTFFFSFFLPFLFLDTQAHLHQYKKALTALTVAEIALSECWASIFDTQSTLYGAYAKNIVYSGQMEQLRIQVDEDLLRDMDEPLDMYMQQFKMIKKRDQERTRRKVDSDRLLYDYE